MIKKVIMKNLTCANCAAKIEKALTSIQEINSASFNFTNQTMLLEVSAEYNETQALKKIQTTVDSIEDDVTVIPYEQRHTIIKPQSLKRYWLVFLGIAVFLMGYFFDANDLISNRLNPFYWAGYVMITHKIMYSTLKGLRRRDFFNENTLMFIATVAAMLINKPFEAVLVILFYTVGEYLQHRAVEQSKKEINALVDLHIDYANVIEDGEVVVKDPLSIKKSDILLIKHGERVPVDGIVVKGKSSLNTSALTGESKLQNVHEGMYILSGNINVGSVIELKAVKEYADSTIAKIIDLLENSTNTKSKTENFITRFARYYTPVVTFMALLMFVIPSLLDPAGIEDYVFRAATFLVISCPCALVLSIPLSYFAGIGASARKGILFKGSNYLDMMNQVDVIGIDKTGTLTHGNFVVDGYTNLRTLHLAASLEAYSNHPISKSIIEENKLTPIALDHVEELPGLGLKATVNDSVILVGNRKLLKQHKVHVKDKMDTAGTNIFVAENNRYIGRVVIKDQIKNTSKDVIRKLSKHYHITMLTGDNQATASEVAYELGNIHYMANLLPEEKIQYFDGIRSKGKKLYVGDGINDAPLLKLADIGLAMGSGSDIAIDVADIIIMNDDLSMLDEAFKISRKTKRIVYQNIVLSLGIKFSFLTLAGFGLLHSMLFAIFADVGITLIAVLNALRLIYRKKDKDGLTTYQEHRATV